MSNRWLALIAMVVVTACDSTPKLDYKVKTTDTLDEGPADFKDVADLKPSVEVTGSAGEFVDAIRVVLVAQAEPAKVTVAVRGGQPSGKSGHVEAMLDVDVTWWALPNMAKARGKLAIAIDYKATSPADVGKKVGEIVVHYLDSRRPKRPEVPVLAPPATAVAVGKSIACSLHSDKSVHCWGAQLAPTVGPVPSKTTIANAVEIVAGDRSVCARLESGEVKCLGELGQDDKSKSHKPAKVCELDKPTKLALGVHTACAIVAGGKVRCWDTDVLDSMDPSCGHKSVEVRGIENATAIASGYHGQCALVKGQAICWTGAEPTPVAAKLPVGVDVAVGFRPCVFDAAGQITCEKVDARDPAGAKLPAGSKLAIEPMYGCAITPAAEEQCFGVIPDDMFELPAMAGTNIRPPTPIQTNVISVGVAIDHSCAVLKDGSVLCSGKYLDSGLATPATKPTKLTIY